MCCNRLIEPNCRSSFSASGSTTVLGIVFPRDVLDAVAEAVQGGADGVGILGWRQDIVGLRADGLGVLLQFQLIDFVVDLALKFVARALELGHEFAHGSGNLRQTPWAEQDKAYSAKKAISEKPRFIPLVINNNTCSLGWI